MKPNCVILIHGPAKTGSSPPVFVLAPEGAKENLYKAPKSAETTAYRSGYCWIDVLSPEKGSLTIQQIRVAFEEKKDLKYDAILLNPNKTTASLVGGGWNHVVELFVAI